MLFTLLKPSITHCLSKTDWHKYFTQLITSHFVWRWHEWLKEQRRNELHRNVTQVTLESWRWKLSQGILSPAHNLNYSWRIWRHQLEDLSIPTPISPKRTQRTTGNCAVCPLLQPLNIESPDRLVIVSWKFRKDAPKQNVGWLYVMLVF